MTDPVFRSAQEAEALYQKENKMASPGKLPARQGGMKAPHEHGNHSGAGTNSGTGDGKGGEVSRGVVTKGTGKNPRKFR